MYVASAASVSWSLVLEFDLGVGGNCLRIDPLLDGKLYLPSLGTLLYQRNGTSL